MNGDLEKDGNVIVVKGIEEFFIPYLSFDLKIFVISRIVVFYWSNIKQFKTVSNAPFWKFTTNS
jgi:hypothetical protein